MFPFNSQVVSSLRGVALLRGLVLDAVDAKRQGVKGKGRRGTGSERHRLLVELFRVGSSIGAPLKSREKRSIENPADRGEKLLPLGTMHNCWTTPIG